MTKLFMFEKPIGMRDTLPILYGAKMKVRHRMLQEIKSWGYQMIETPALEYYETVGEASAILNQQLFKLLDQQGRSLVLRPDMTAPIARVAASKLLKKRIPLRLSYSANVYRAQQREGGRPAEFEQIGIECIGNSTVSGDAESIALLVSTLKVAGLHQFKISVGHVGFIQELLVYALKSESEAEQCRKFLFEKNYVGYRNYVSSLKLPYDVEECLLSLLKMRGLEEVFQIAKTVVNNEAGKKAIGELEDLWVQLHEYDVQDYVSFDLSLISHMSYYTGILFEVYAGSVGSPIGNGGRYDNLLNQFGYQAPATGFGLVMDRLLEALGEIEEENDVICIMFSKEQRKEAISLAKEMRESGEAVVLQDIDGVSDVQAYVKSFTTVNYLVNVQEERK